MFTLPVYPYRRPDELDRPRPEPHEVIVVGGGLTGLAVALDLAQRGVRVVVLDDDNTVGVRGLASRGMVWAQRTLDILDRLGVADRVVGKGVRWNVGRVLCRDQPVSSFTLQSQPDMRHNGFANVQQYYLEQFLVEALQDHPRVDLRWLNKVVGVHPHADGVALEVATPDGSYRTQARWVVACDGANSGIARQLGLQPVVHDRTEDRWIIIDVTVQGRPWPEERWTWLDAGANNGRAVWRHKMADDTWRLDFQLSPEEDASEAASEAGMRRRVAALAGDELQFEIAWSGVWGYRHECLASMREGRVLFAGDSAHLVAPFGARGGNGGIQDADNLGWKLAAVLKEGADAALLDTYAAERKQAALCNIREAMRSSRFVNPAGDASAASWRDAIIALAPLHALAARMINTGRLSMPCVYAASPLARGAHAAVGSALPNVVVAQGREPLSLHGLLGPWFTGLVMSDRLPPGLPEHPLLHWVAVGASADDAGRQALQRQLGTPADGGELWLVRPDGHVMAALPAGSAATRDCADWIEQVLLRAPRRDNLRSPA